MGLNPTILFLAVIVSGFYSAGDDKEGRGTDSPGGRHPVELTVPPPPSFLIFMPNALPATTLPICPGLGHAQNYAGLHPQWLVLYTHCRITLQVQVL